MKNRWDRQVFLFPKNRWGHFFFFFIWSKQNGVPFLFVYFKPKNANILILASEKIDEATFFKSEKRQMKGIYDRWGRAWETVNFFFPYEIEI